jgi:hypothetical protein
LDAAQAISLVTVAAGRVAQGRSARRRPGRVARVDAGGELDKLLRALPGDADGQALLHIAIDADRQRHEVVDIDAAATAAYRRVLDHYELPFENYWYEAMLE